MSCETSFVCAKEGSSKLLCLCEDVDMAIEMTDFAITFCQIKQIPHIQEFYHHEDKIGFSIIEYFAEILKKIFQITKSV